jgi:hypothetical protein
MKNLATIIALFLCFSAFPQDTLKRTEWIEGKKTLVLEITTSSDFWLIVAKAIPIVLAAIATALFIFYKPKSNEDER